MEWYVRWFVRTSLIWLGVGVAFGVAMAFWPWALAFRTAHMHANLLGFVSMMIFGVAYHVIPRFNGRPLHRPRWAEIHFWLANAGLALLVLGWSLRGFGRPVGVTTAQAGAVVSATGILLFIANLWVTLGPRMSIEELAASFRPSGGGTPGAGPPNT